MNNRIEFISNIIVEPFFRMLQEKEHYWKEKDISFVRIHEVFTEDHISYLKEWKSGDIIVVLLKLESIAPDFMYRFYMLTKEEAEKAYYQIVKYYKRIWEHIRSLSNATILLNSFELEVHDLSALQNNLNKNNYIARINHFIREELCNESNTFIIDLNRILMKIGYNKYYDFRYWYMSNSPYSSVTYKEIANCINQYNDIMNGHLIKCIVLDCDHVLWGGIVGEDGVDNIKIGQEYPGNAYYRFQEKLLELNNLGVVLLLSSRNNRQDVLEVFNKRQMPLSMENIVDYRINWDDKATGILDMITEINISVDSVLFIDDSRFEIELVKRTLPDINVLHLPSNKPEDYVSILMNTGYFNVINQSEKNQRNEYYISNKNRKDLKNKLKSSDIYLKSLETNIIIFNATENEKKRILELSIRTNQFNSSDERLNSVLIDSYLKEKNKNIFCLRVKDCFGELGIVGFICAEFKNEVMIIRYMTVSCRALGRKIEDMFLDRVVYYGFDRKSINKVQIIYNKTKKNGLVENLIYNKKFSNVDNTDLFEATYKEYTFFEHPEYFICLMEGAL